MGKNMLGRCAMAAVMTCGLMLPNGGAWASEAASAEAASPESQAQQIEEGSTGAESADEATDKVSEAISASSPTDDPEAADEDAHAAAENDAESANAEPAIATQSIDTYASDGQDKKINLNQDVHGAFSGSMSSYCYYRIHVPERGYVSLDFAHDSLTATSSHWDIEFQDSNKKLIASYRHDISGDMRSSFKPVGLNAGDYLIKVSASYNSDSFTLRANYAKGSEWEIESNDTVDTANNVSLNQPWKGSLSWRMYSPYSDEDYYKLNLKSSARLSFDCEEINAIQSNYSNGFSVELRDANNNKLTSMYYTPNKGLSQTLECGVVSAGTYYVHVSGSSERTYKITPHAYTGTTSTGWQSINGSWYYLDSTGKMATGWQNIDGKRYYFSSTGEMQQNWLKYRYDWYWLGSDGAMKTAWQNIGGAWYWFAGDGKMQTGWQSIAGGWYWMDSEGRMATGWHKISGTWYLFSSGGTMQTNWQYVNGSWYWLGSDGAMRTGWQSIGGYWYYFNTTSGAMQTGWFKVGYNSWYYANAAGQMQSNCWVGDYYLTSSGKMATNTWIGPYHVGSDGRWDNR